MMEAQGPEAVLELAMKRAARFTGSTDGRLVLAALDRVHKAAVELADMRKIAMERRDRRWRVVELRLPSKDPAP